MILKTTDQVMIDDSGAYLFKVTQQAHGIDHLKWIVIFGDRNQTKMLTAACPIDEKPEVSEMLKSVILRPQKLKNGSLATKSAEAAPTQADGARKIDRDSTQPKLKFSIEPSLKLKPVRDAEKISPLFAYSKDGVLPAASPKDPLFIAAKESVHSKIENTRQFATERVFQVADTKIATLLSTTPITIDGMDGYESIANATSASTGVPITAYQVVLFDEECLYVMQGLVGSDLRDEFVPEFKSMARSLKRKP
jgi:hypothetical protein